MFHLILKEWLSIVLVLILAITSYYTNFDIEYTISEIEVIFILFLLLIVIHGLQRSNLLLYIASSIEKGKAIPLKLILTTFFLSMIVTNDVALIIMVPLALAINISHKEYIVILEALSANAGSALTPIGNPQNLFIYWHYKVPIDTFMMTISPFVIFFLILLSIFSLIIFRNIKTYATNTKKYKVNSKAYIYLLSLAIIILIVVHILPVIYGLFIIMFVVALDIQTLKIDYALLFNFLLFFGIADNLSILFEDYISHFNDIFLLSAFSSQIISNVPATLLISNFTSNWQELLWGSSVGGFGSLVGSLANLIAYRIYITHKNSSHKLGFTIKFIVIGYIAFVFGIVLYYSLNYQSYQHLITLFINS